eukprot:s1665_g16.t1
MILLMSVVCAASGFTLEIPELPDLIGTVGKVLRGNFTLKMVEEPDVFLPKVSQIETMTREESMERFHWFFCVYVLIFLGVTIVGSVIMVVGPILKSKCLASSDDSDSEESSELLSSEASDSSVNSYEALGPTFTALSPRTQQCLVILSVGVTMSLSLILLTFLCFESVLSAAAPALGKKLNRAMRNGDMVTAVLLWEEAELGHLDNLQLFGLILPRLTFFLDTLSRHGFNKDPTELNEEELAMVQGIGAAAVYLGQSETYRCSNLGELGTKALAESLKTNRSLKKLRLDANNIGAAGAQALGEMLKVDVTLEELYLSGNNIGARGAQAVAESSGTWTGAEVLAESLKINRSLKLLRLEKNNICAAGAQAIGEMLKVNDNNIGATGAQAVAESLKTNPSLKNLDLDANNIGAAGAQALAESLKINRSLEWLHLGDNNLGDAGAQALGDALKVNVTLTYLSLVGNNICAAGAQALAAGLRQNRGLGGLLISPGSVGDEGRQALEDAEKTKKERGEDFVMIWIDWS